MRHPRFRLARLCLAATILPLVERPARAQTPPAPPTFSSEVELITVDAVVLDAAGHPVPGLTRDDFLVSEDGRPQEIVNFEASGLETPPPAPRTASVLASNEAPAGGVRVFAVLIDDVGIAPVRAEYARRAAASFLQRSARDGDEVTLGTSSGDVWWSARLPEGRDDLLAVLLRVKGAHVESSSLDRMTD